MRDDCDEVIRQKMEALRLRLGLAGGSGGPLREPRGHTAAWGAWPGGTSIGDGDAGTRGASGPEAGRNIDDIPDAREVVSDHGKCLIIDRPVEVCPGVDSLEAGRIVQAYQAFVDRADGAQGGGCCKGLAFLDLETTGLCATPLFLAGTLLVCEGEIRSLQFLARDYSEERCLISALDSHLKEYDVCITFNGKSFDLPYLRERAKYHRLDLEASPQQIDLLHHARRRWRHRLPNCRLLTLEWYILGRRRIGDVDGWEVPCIYHEFVHTKDARKLKHVLRHNLMDVLSMAQLLISLAEA